MSIFFVYRETTINEKHRCWRIKKFQLPISSDDLTEGSEFFCPSSSPNGQKEKVSPCPLCLGGNKNLLQTRNRNYE